MSDTPLFAGDTGELSADTRRVLAKLLRGPRLDGQRDPKLWATLVRDRAILRSRLHEMGLEMVIDGEQLVAVLRQADTGDVEITTLLPRKQLTLKETILLLHLRGELSAADSRGERCVLDRAHIVEHVRAYMQADETDTVKYDRQTEAALNKLGEQGMVHSLAGDDLRVEVSQALRLLFSVEEIEALTRVYQTLLPEGEAGAAALASLKAGTELGAAAGEEALDRAPEGASAGEASLHALDSALVSAGNAADPLNNDNPFLTGDMAGHGKWVLAQMPSRESIPEVDAAEAADDLSEADAPSAADTADTNDALI